METKHTPGPWEAKMNALGIMLLIVGKSNLKWKSVCSLDLIWDYHNNKEEAESNAKLIAAAPELLEALQYLLKDYDEGGVYIFGKDEALIEKAKAAIKKATT